MTDNAQSIPSAAVNLRDQSDALLKRCGYDERGNLGAGGRYWWRGRDGSVVRWHPYANSQDAIDLAEAMGLLIDKIERRSGGNYGGRFIYKGGFVYSAGRSIAEAICAAIEEVVE